jgi:hypothetical protein
MHFGMVWKMTNSCEFLQVNTVVVFSEPFSITPEEITIHAVSIHPKDKAKSKSNLRFLT